MTKQRRPERHRPSKPGGEKKKKVLAIRLEPKYNAQLIRRIVAVDSF